jgi:hypothetical protein
MCGTDVVSSWMLRLRVMPQRKRAALPGVDEKSAVKLRDFQIACSQVPIDKVITECALWPFKP